MNRTSMCSAADFTSSSCSNKSLSFIHRSCIHHARSPSATHISLVTRTSTGSTPGSHAQVTPHDRHTHSVLHFSKHHGRRAEHAGKADSFSTTWLPRLHLSTIAYHTWPLTRMCSLHANHLAACRRKSHRWPWNTVCTYGQA